jgi:hypothetical protein
LGYASYESPGIRRAAAVAGVRHKPPQWNTFANGWDVDTANVKSDGNIVSAYVKHAGAGKQSASLYELDCKGDQIRVHFDTQRYRAVKVDGGGTVVVFDDGFGSAVPGTGNAQIENALCGIVAQQEAERAKHEHRRSVSVPGTTTSTG